MVKFKKGDVVFLKNQGRFGLSWRGPMVVEYTHRDSVIAVHPRDGDGGFDHTILELAEGPW